MPGNEDIRLTVNLSDLSLAAITPELSDKYGIPADSSGAVIVSSGDLEGGVISRIQSDSYELFVHSPDDISRGVGKMRQLGDATALLRFSKRTDRYRWIRVRIP